MTGHNNGRACEICDAPLGNGLTSDPYQGVLYIYQGRKEARFNLCYTHAIEVKEFITKKMCEKRFGI